MKRTLLHVAVAGCLAFAGVSAIAAEIEGLPPVAEPRAVKLAEPREKTLANGLRVLVVERRGLPLLAAALVIRSGAEADPAAGAGLASFAAKLLTQGTLTRSATEIASEVEALGATLKAEAKWDATTIALTTLSENAVPAFALLADVVRNPKFAPEETERLRRQSLDELRLSLEEPGIVARLATTRAVLGAGLYAHAAEGTPASIARLKRDQLATFHTAHFTPDRALLVIAGDVTATVAFGLAEKAFGDWKIAPDAARVDAAKVAPAEKPRTILIDMPQAGQAAVAVGAPGIPRQAPDYFAGEVANTVLGGGYTSRLNQEIRIKRGLSYGVRSSLATLREGGLFTARAQTKNASAAEVAEVMLAEFARLGSEDVPADYLASRQAVLTGEFARDFETNEGYVKRLADFAVHDLPLSVLDEYADRIRAVTAAEVRVFATTHLAPAAMTVVVAGVGKDCAGPLRTLFPALEVIPQSALDLDLPALRDTAKP